jgi:cellulose biosynthesis protein BcsQ
MSKVISVTNVKGGVGKSITALFLSRILADSGKRVLLIDLDSQNSLTSYFVENYADIEGNTIFELLLNKVSIEECIISRGPRLDFIPSDINLSALTLQLSDSRDTRLMEKLASIREKYQYIVIDTPPNLHVETKMALAISNVVIVPTLLERWAVRSIEIILNYIRNTNLTLQESLGVAMEKVLVLPTLIEKNRKIQDIVLRELTSNYQTMVCDGISRRTDIQKLSYLGFSGGVSFNRLDAYNEYRNVVKRFESIPDFPSFPGK